MSRKPTTPPNLPAHLTVQVNLDPGTSLELEVEARDPQGNLLKTKSFLFDHPAPKPPPAPKTPLSERLSYIRLPARLNTFLPAAADRIIQAFQWLWTTRARWPVIGALLIYLLVRLIGLTSFPIYFFTDEAVQTILAQDLVRDGFQNYDHDFLPTYFVNGNQYNLSTSVYLQVIPNILFGRSIAVTRGTAMLTTLIAAVSVGLIMSRIFKSKYPWLAILILSLIPAWFLHSRTAFETTLATTFFAAFLYSYLMYREESPRWFYAVVLTAGLCFYSYSPAQMVVAVSAVLLLLNDIPYHWKNRITVLKGIGLGALVLLPYVRFLIQHGEENFQHLMILRSYWIMDMTIWEKLGTFFRIYLHGLDPTYWFLPNSVDIERHIMLGYGHVGWYLFPFVALGIGLCLWRIRESRYRLLLIAVLAAPAGAALVELGITRAMFMVIPITLLSALAIGECVDFLVRKRWPQWLLSGALFLSFTFGNVYTLVDTLRNSLYWFDDYGLGAMQYGGQELFATARQFMIDHPGTYLLISPAWANGTDILARFYSESDDLDFNLGSIEGYINDRLNMPENAVFVMIPTEYDLALSCGKFTDIHVLQTIPWPDGRTGFYFVSLRYVDNIDELFQNEIERRHAMMEETVTLPDGSSADVTHSLLDMGSAQSLFDGDMLSVARTEAANPMQVIIDFSSPARISSVSVRAGGVPTEVVVLVYASADSQDHQEFSVQAEQSANPRDVLVEFGQTLTADRIEVQIRSVNDQEPAHVHVWEITFQ